MKFLKQILIVVIVIIITSVVVKAGDEFFGKKESDDGNNCEAGMVLVESSSGSFCIDIYENSPGEDCYEIEIDNQLDTSRNLNKKECIPVSEKERQPWKYISQTQARVACAKAGKRLPTSREWYLASLGISDLSDDWSKHDCHVDSNWDTQPGLTGSGRNCVSAYGAYDMIGNLWEWVDEEISDEVNFARPGVLATANQGKGTCTNGSQFFITMAHTEWLQGYHTIFGEVFAGYVVVWKLCKGEKDKANKPLIDQRIIKAYLEDV